MLRCLKYLLRAPTGTFIAPDILYFNWGLHNLILNVNNTIPGQSGPVSAYAPYLEKIVSRLIGLWFKIKYKHKIDIWHFISMICNKEVDDIVKNNANAESIMLKYNITTINLHEAIVSKCGPVPQSQCWGTRLLLPTLSANNGKGSMACRYGNYSCFKKILLQHK